MRTNPADWVRWDTKEMLPFNGGISFHIRTNQPCTVLNEDGLILAYGEGEQYIHVTGSGAIDFYCDGAVFLKPSSRVQERVAQSEQVFTTLDRPAPLSPEMQAISMMMRRNELERERDRKTMETRLADQSRLIAASKRVEPAQAPSANKAEDVRQNAGASSPNAEKPKRRGKGKDVDAADVSAADDPDREIRSKTGEGSTQDQNPSDS